MSIEAPQFVRSAIDLAHTRIVHPYLTHGEAQQDREVAHERMLDLMEKFQSNPIAMRLLRELFVFEDPILKTELAPGSTSRNPLGLAPGVDKDARIYEALGEGLGFGVVKIGSVTKVPYEGNDRPRIFDLPNSDGLINRMGFPGKGSDEAEERLKKDKPLSRRFRLIVSVAASRKSFEKGTQLEDYAAVASQMLPYGDGQEVNVSSPNTEGVRGLQDPEVFSDLSQRLKEIYLPNGQKKTLVLYKFGPDLSPQDREKNVKTARDNGADGVTLGNTTTDPEVRSKLSDKDIHRMEVGGISGAPLRGKALEISHQIYQHTGGEIPIIMAGGIANAEDAWNALTYGGATAFDVYTAFVRLSTSTPNFGYYLLRDLAKAMRKFGLTSMEDFKQYRGKTVRFPKI